MCTDGNKEGMRGPDTERKHCITAKPGRMKLMQQPGYHQHTQNTLYSPTHQFINTVLLIPYPHIYQAAIGYYCITIFIYTHIINSLYQDVNLALCINKVHLAIM